MQKELVDTLSRLLEIYEAQYKAGMKWSGNVVAAHAEFINAQLDAAENSSSASPS